MMSSNDKQQHFLEPFISPKDIKIEHGVFSFDLVLMIVFAVAVVPALSYSIHDKVKNPVKSNLGLSDYYILSIILVYLVIGLYQQYFWTKSNKFRETSIMPKTTIDKILNNCFSMNTYWICIYNLIYYLIFGLILISVRDYKHFAIIILGGALLLTGLNLIWYFFPNTVEERIQTNGIYLFEKTQKIDSNHNNACPSAHVVFSVYAFYLLKNVIGFLPAILFPILISLSCIVTSQHVSTDAVFGIIYTVLIYKFGLHKIDPKSFPL
jgi:hypothetical protein